MSQQRNEIGALLPDFAPITERVDQLAEVGRGLKTAMLILAGALVLHTVVLIAARHDDHEE